MHSHLPFLAALSFWLAVAVAVPVSAQVVNDPSLELEVLDLGAVSSPSTLAFYGPNSFLLLEKDTGRVINVANGVRQTAPALDLAVHSGPERGLLGIAIHPDYPAGSRDVYLFYTPSATGSDTSAGTPLLSRVESYSFSGGALTNSSPVLTVNAPNSPAHLGGVMAFGPDEKLYVIVGDHLQNGGLQNNPPLLAADDTGVIFRLDPDGSPASGNPLSAQGFDLSQYYAYGIRNSFGLAFDPQTGDLWQTENGPDGYDELNRVTAGFNSGWNAIMGPDSRDPNSTADLTDINGGAYSDPEFSWETTIAPTGLAFPVGSALGSAYDDKVLVAGYSGDIYSLPLTGNRRGIASPNAGLDDLVLDPGDNATPIDFASGFGGISDLKIGPDGFLYGVSILFNYVFVIRPEGASSAVHDFALIGLKASSRAKLTEKKPVKELKAKLQLQNRSPLDETIADLATLEALVELDVDAAGECGSPVITLVPPKRFPITLKSKKKLSLTYRVAFDCADTYSYSATLFHEAIDDQPDTHTVDDVCPRPPLPLGVDPNPDGKIKDKGCGAKVSGGSRGGPVTTEVIQK
jgi:glucose/arabinose dehydrogenase